MRLEASLNQRLDMRMQLAPRMIQSMEILQLPIMALQERIQQELEENPVLEVKDTREEGEAAGEGAEPDLEPAPPATDTSERGDEPLVIEDNGTNELDFDRLDALSRDYEEVFNEEHRPSRNGVEKSTASTTPCRT